MRDTLSAISHSKNIKSMIEQPGPGQYSSENVGGIASARKMGGKFAKGDRMKTERMRSPGPGEYDFSNPLNKKVAGVKIGT